MKDKQLSTEERHMIGALLHMRLNQAEIARCLERPRCTVSREIAWNSVNSGASSAHHAVSKASGRRRRSRYGSHFSPADWKVVERLLRDDYSPDQVSGHLKQTGGLRISHETIYKHVWEDKRTGGTLHTHLRCASKKRRKRYGAYDSRGRLAGKRPITDRPEEAENRKRLGDWEIDTVLGSGRACILTLVDRKSGYVQIGRLAVRTISETNGRLRKLIARAPSRYLTITSDNGCEFHGYRKIELHHPVEFYFAAPHHSW